MPARNGAAYLEGLRDAREIWLGDERVADVTTHPALYERFFSGDPVRNLAMRYRTYDVAPCTAHVERILAESL